MSSSHQQAPDDDHRTTCCAGKAPEVVRRLRDLHRCDVQLWVFPAPGPRRSNTPVWANIATGAVIGLLIVCLPIMEVAKLASAFQLLIFALVNLAVVVMRESRLESYEPGFRSPLYPWTQLTGVAITIVLVIEMGLLAIAFTSGLIAATLLWYRFYSRASATPMCLPHGS